MRVLILGAGFGGLELATRPSEAPGDDIEIDLIDRSDSHHAEAVTPSHPVSVTRPPIRHPKRR